uniref:Uncharacterized protein n=1 Tax=Meloidogyne floridensis TaxID=298350 RepID=A0A915NW76_9BILA
MNNYRNDTVTGKDRLVNHKFGNWSNREGINLSNLNEVFPATSISKFPTNVEEFKYFTQQQKQHHPPNNSSSSSSICIHSLPHRNHNFLSMTTSLTNNNNNENKSIEHQNTSLILQQQQQSNNNIFLHRSPSGAQRKIRQKAQQQFQQQSGGMSQNVVNKGGNNGGGGGNTEPVVNNNLKQMAYRNLINENGYHSLLGGDAANNRGEATTITSSTTNFSSDELERLSAGQLIDRMNKLESITRSPQQQQQFSNLHSFDSSWKAGGIGINNNTGGLSIDKMPSPLTLQSFQLEQQQQPTTNTFALRKPTVQ